MSEWRFVESDEDGRSWMKNPKELHAVIAMRDAHSPLSGEWRRIMVVTRGWLEQKLVDVRPPHGRIALPPMLVVPDASPNELQGFIEAAVKTGGLEHFASSSAG
jgi:hypothetical protein